MANREGCGALDREEPREAHIDIIRVWRVLNTYRLRGQRSWSKHCCGTGPMHVSAAVKTPVVALFALTNPPEQWGPWRVPHRQLYHDVACRICYSRICPYGQECLCLVTPEMVVDAAAELLKETLLGVVDTYAGKPLANARGVLS